MKRCASMSADRSAIRPSATRRGGGRTAPRRSARASVASSAAGRCFKGLRRGPQLETVRSETSYPSRATFAHVALVMSDEVVLVDLARSRRANLPAAPVIARQTGMAARPAHHSSVTCHEGLASPVLKTELLIFLKGQRVGAVEGVH